MKRWLFLLFIISTQAAWCQTARQYLDSANTVRLKDFQQALDYANRAYRLAARQHDSSTMAGANISKGIAFYLMGDYESALPNYLQALDYYERNEDTAGVIKTYAELIVFYKQSKQVKQARAAIGRGLQMADASGNLDGLANLNNNAGLFYKSINQFDSAARSFRRGLYFYEQLGDKVGMSYSYDYLATSLAEAGRLEEALPYLVKSRDLRLQTGDRMGVSESINNIGELLIEQNKPAQSLLYFRAARDTATKLNYKDLAAHTWKMESRALEKTRHYQEAYYALSRYQELREELLNEKRIAAVTELQTKYETERKERQNLELQQINRAQELEISRRNLALMGLALFLLLAAGIAYMIHNRYRLRQQAKLQEERLHQERLRGEAMVATEERERQRLARELHDGIGQMLAAARRSLQAPVSAARYLPDEATGPHPLALLDESIAEVRQLSHSMMPPSLRNRSLTDALNELAKRLSQSSGISIRTEWSGAASLNLHTNQNLMIYRAIQELLNNAIRHAAPTEISLEMVNHGDMLSILVMDNGCGFDPGQVAGGLGLNNIQSRIGFIGGEVTWDSQPGRGATCMMAVPVNHE